MVEAEWTGKGPVFTEYNRGGLGHALDCFQYDWFRS